MGFSLQKLRKHAGEDRVLIYSFSFPHYRISVLEEIQRRFGEQLELLSGSQNREGVRGLTEKELPGLQVSNSKHLGPFSWDRDIFHKAVSKRYSVVVLAPAVSSLSTWAILGFRKLSGRTTLLWGQCGKPGDRSVKRLLQELMNRMADRLLVYGGFEEAGAVEYGTPSEKIHRVMNAVPLQPVEFTSHQLADCINQKVTQALELGDLRLIYVGRIISGKNVEILLQAGELLRHKYPKLSILFIGDGSEASRLRGLYPDPRYQFLGAIYDKEELQKEILNATFVVSPSTMGLLALDALSAGVPVLVPDHPHNGSEVEALTYQINAFSFQHDNPHELSNTVDSALHTLRTIDNDNYFLNREKSIQAWSARAVGENITDIITPLVDG